MSHIVYLMSALAPPQVNGLTLCTAKIGAERQKRRFEEALRSVFYYAFVKMIHKDK
jgi:hypothetical protein